MPFTGNTDSAQLTDDIYYSGKNHKLVEFLNLLKMRRKIIKRQCNGTDPVPFGHLLKQFTVNKSPCHKRSDSGHQRLIKIIYSCNLLKTGIQLIETVKKVHDPAVLILEILGQNSANDSGIAAVTRIRHGFSVRPVLTLLVPVDKILYGTQLHSDVIYESGNYKVLKKPV